MHSYRFSVVTVFLLTLCILFAAPVLGAKQNDSSPQRIDADPNSTFALGSVASYYWIFPGDQATIPLTLTLGDPATLVGYTENHVTWDHTKLTLDDVTLGAAAGGTLTWTETGPGAATITISQSPPATLGTGSIADLNFTVGCFPFGSSTPISFDPGENLNFYIADNTPYAPVLSNGTFTMGQDYGPGFSALAAVAAPGQADVPYTVTFFRTAPGTLNSMTLEYDDDAMAVVDITPEDLVTDSGGTFTYSDDGLGLVTIDFTDVVLPSVLGHQPLVQMHFAMNNGNDDYNDPATPAMVSMSHTATCETEPTVATGGPLFNTISIPDHTASVDIGEHSYVYTANYFDVSFSMQSNLEINDYKLFVNFPDADVELHATTPVVAIGGYSAPGATAVGDLITVSSGAGTAYDVPSAATVFKLRFVPVGTPAVGEVYPITFDTGDGNYDRISFEMDQDFDSNGSPDLHDATVSQADGSITMTGGGGGGGGGGGSGCCPTLFAWDGRGFSLENTILAECDGKNVKSDVTDFYMITNPVKARDGQLRFRIQEDATAVSEFRDFELIAVDHPKDQAVFATKKGEIVTSATPYALKWARDHKGRDITELLATPDGVYYTSTEGGYFDVSFGVLSEDQVGKFVAETHDAQQKNRRPCEALTTGALNLSNKLNVSLKTSHGWVLMSESDARHKPVRQANMIEREIIAGQEVILRYSWESRYYADVIEFRAAQPYEGEIYSPAISVVEHSVEGEVFTRLGSASARAITLANGESIELAFDVSHLPALAEGNDRSYIFVSRGRYAYPSDEAEESRPMRFALNANVPNPFNPNTTIHYELAKSTNVHITIHDVRGRIVRTLVSGVEGAGAHAVVWDGRSESGERVSSGVYFYRLHTAEFNRTRKMVMLK